MIDFIDVHKRYPGRQEALSGINLHIEEGEMVFLTGHSGAGKSTLLKLIALIEQSHYGQLFVNGQNIQRIPASRIPYYRRQIGIVFQEHNLLNDRTVFDNVALPLVISGEPYRDINRKVRAALDKVGLLSKERHLPTTLSGGEQQRVGIARAVVSRPLIILADEPTGNLDPSLSRDIMLLFEQFHHIGSTVFIATHDIALANTLTHRHIALANGRVITP